MEPGQYDYLIHQNLLRCYNLICQHLNFARDFTPKPNTPIFQYSVPTAVKSLAQKTRLCFVSERSCFS